MEEQPERKKVFLKNTSKGKYALVTQKKLPTPPPIFKLKTTSVVKDVQKLGPLHTVGENAKW